MVVGNRALAINQWHHLGANYDGNNLRVFVDGSLDGEIPIERINIYDTIYALTIGRSGFIGMSEPFVHGWLDDVRMSNNYYDIPEPSTLGLLGLGSLALLRRKE